MFVCLALSINHLLQHVLAPVCAGIEASEGLSALLVLARKCFFLVSIWGTHFCVELEWPHGWMEFPSSVSADQIRPNQSFHAPNCPPNWCFSACLWPATVANPPLEVVFADGLLGEEADAVMSVDQGGLAPVLPPHGLFRQVLNHVTATVDA